MGLAELILGTEACSSPSTIETHKTDGYSLAIRSSREKVPPWARSIGFGAPLLFASFRRRPSERVGGMDDDVM